MADLDDHKDGKDFGLETPQVNPHFDLKGCGSLDWGMQSRLSQIFNPVSKKTVMLAFDHGYFQGATTGLERIDLNIKPLFEDTDVLMATRGQVRANVPANTNKPLVLRCSGANSMLPIPRYDDLSLNKPELDNETIAVNIEDVIRLNASAMAVNIYVGAEYEHKSLTNLINLIDTGNRYGIPTMAVTGVGAAMERDWRYFSLASRLAAEMGSQFVKTYFVEKGFERITAGCPVPIVIAGGKKLPELDALAMCYKAIDQGASGVDMGRNIFQSDDPIAMIKAVRAVVHNNMHFSHAYELFLELKAK
ncbi:3-hydroxy-5-phosphonooxypentane-2,4-dione thiolase [Photobacterium nomapromontoriensis]|uniref:3-hydroxy-5-phosphonooxypentane-2,4-dione thiolase n=1 Tax=Photobacterium nomapromontoriensis TaxID=2910237 RepID=UPI003D137C6C